MEKARRDLASAIRLLDGEPPYLDTAVYHCQQAAEKALKGFLARRGRPRAECMIWSSCSTNARGWIRRSIIGRCRGHAHPVRDAHSAIQAISQEPSQRRPAKAVDGGPKSSIDPGGASDGPGAGRLTTGTIVCKCPGWARRGRDAVARGPRRALSGHRTVPRPAAHRPCPHRCRPTRLLPRLVRQGIGGHPCSRARLTCKMNSMATRISVSVGIVDLGGWGWDAADVIHPFRRPSRA